MSDDVARFREALRVFAPNIRSTTEATVQLLRVTADAFDESDLWRVADRLAGRREPTIAAAVSAHVSAAAIKHMASEERPSEKWRREGAELLAEFDRLGGGREAAAKIARDNCRGDPAAREALERRIRRLVQKREEKRTLSV